MQLAVRRPSLTRFDFHSLARIDVVLGLALLAYGALYLSWLVLGWGGADQQVAIADGIYIPLGALVVAIAVRAAHTSGDRAVRRAWWLLAAAFTSYAIGDLIWFFIEVVQGHVVPTPSLADLGYLAFYPFLILALLSLPRTQHRSDRALLLDLGIVCTGCAAAVWWLVVGPVVAAIGSDTVETLVALAYPVGDMLVLFALAAAVLGRVRGVRPAVLVLLGIGTLCNAVADLSYARLALEESYAAGGWLDIAYMAGWLALGLAGLVHLASHDAAEQTSGHALARTLPGLPYLATAVVFGLVVVAARELPIEQHVLINLAVLVTLLVSARQYLTTRQNTRLLAQRLHSEARFAEILRNATDVVVVADRNGTITYATPSAPMLVDKGATIVGRPVTSLIQREDGPLVTELLRTASEIEDGAGPVACRSAADPPLDLEISVTNLTRQHARRRPRADHPRCHRAPRVRTGAPVKGSP